MLVIIDPLLLLLHFVKDGCKGLSMWNDDAIDDRKPIIAALASKGLSKSSSYQAAI